MNSEVKIIDVNAKNITEHPQAICFINPKHEYYHFKLDWLKKEFKKGLKIKLLYLEGEKKPIGFIEYTPSQNCWRAVNAKEYMFIHCLWINGNKYKNQGLGSLLIKEAENDSKNMIGTAVVTSSKSFMADSSLFLKNNYKKVDETKTEQLLVKQNKKGELPCFNNFEKELKQYKDLTILYSKQCPWVARFIEEVKPILKKEKLNPRIIEIDSSQKAQKAPSVYGAFNLIYNGKILADRYISTTRFLNLVTKQIKK